MIGRRSVGAAGLVAVLAATLPSSLGQSQEPIRLRQSPAVTETRAEERDPLAVVGGPRRGFDYEAFEARLESLWFQRKALLAEGRDPDAAQQGRMIRSFCAEEGVRKLEPLAAALIVEADRYHRQGDYGRALASLELAELFDPDRPQTHWATARILWESGRSRLGAAARAVSALRAAGTRSIHDLSLVQPLSMIVVLALSLLVAVFALAMVARHQLPLRHEVEEWAAHAADERVAKAAGLAVLLLPLCLWIGAAWVFVYWLVVTFRYQKRSERLTTLAMLLLLAALAPAHRFAVSVYGATADPVVRTTLAAADGEYAPDRIVKLRGLVDAHPDHPVYRLLIAGLYKNGRYFEEAFEEYKRALLLDPRLVAAHVNVGNIFYASGQYGEAIANYRRALDVDPRSLIALFNLHLAQSEAFRFQEAEDTLAQARALDPSGLARLFSEGRDGTERATVVDARIESASLWQAAIDGGRTVHDEGLPAHDLVSLRSALTAPTSIVALLAIGACLLALWSAQRYTPGQRCPRCGRAHCPACRSGREHPELCGQCVHLFVRADGLAPETKGRKLYQIERHATRRRWTRRLASWLVPGTGHLLRGHPAPGLVLVAAWCTAWLAFRPAVVAPLERLLAIDTGVTIVDPRSVPLPFAVDALAVLALSALALTWIVANVGRRTRGEA